MQIGTPKVIGTRVLQTCDIVSPNPVVESCCILIASLPELSMLGKQFPESEKLPVQKIVEKLVHFRLEFRLDDDSKDFKPADWWATIMGTISRLLVVY